MKRVFSLMVLALFFTLCVYAQGNEVVYQIDGMDDVIVESIEYHTFNDKPLTMDIYYPPTMDAETQLPAVIFITGFPDSVIIEAIGRPLKDEPPYTSWARLVAASGLIAVTYETEQADDLSVLISYIRDNAESLKINGDRLGIYAASGNPPIAISYIMQDDRNYIKAAVFYYGVMLSEGEESLATANEICGQIGCYTVEEGFDEFRLNLPMLVVRAGLDHPELNATIEQFVADATRGNAQLTFINHTTGIHAFDSATKTRQSQDVVSFTVAFLVSKLGG